MLYLIGVIMLIAASILLIGLAGRGAPEGAGGHPPDSRPRVTRRNDLPGGAKG